MTDRPRVFSQSLIVFFAFLGLAGFFTLILIFHLYGGGVGWIEELAQNELYYIFIPPDLSQLSDRSWTPVLINIGITALIITLMTLLLNRSLRVQGSILRALVFSYFISAVSFMISGAILTSLSDGLFSAESDFGQLTMLAALLGTVALKGWLPSLAAVVAYHAGPTTSAESDEVMYPGKLKIKWRDDLPEALEGTSEISTSAASSVPVSITSKLVASQFLQAALNALALIVILIGIAYASNLIPTECARLTTDCVEGLYASWLWPIFLIFVTLAAAYGAHQIGKHRKVTGAVGLSFFISLLVIGVLWIAGITTFFADQLFVESWLGITIDLIVVALSSAAGAIMGYHIPRLGL